MLAIFKREFKSYFQNIIGWLFCGAILAFFGIYFTYYNLTNGVVYLSYPLSSITAIFLIAMPILTMRSFSEERKAKTDQLILTAPVPLGKIVWGKYLALVAVFSIDVVIIGLTPLIMSMFGTVPLLENYVVLFGFWLLGCAFLAIGMFLSSLTESQVIAAVVSFGVFFLSYMMDAIISLITSEENWLTNALSYLNLNTPFSYFTSGCLDLTAVVYYVSIALLFVFLTGQSIQKRRWSMTKNKIGTGVFSVGFIAISVVITIVANIVVTAIPTTYTSIDCSYTQLYNLSSDTKEYLASLEEDITIYVLNDESSKDEQIDETLSRIAALSKHISVEYVSVTTNPNFYANYTDSSPSTNSLIVVSEERSKVIDYYDMYIYETGIDYTTYSYTYDLTGYDCEGQVVSAIEYVTLDSDELPVVYYITDHDEYEIGSAFQEVLEKANIEYEELEIFNEESIPEDAAAIIINCPQSDFNEADAQKVIDYLQAGGKAIIIGDCTNQDLPNFYSILEAYGISTVTGLVVENDSNYYYRAYGQYFILPVVESTSYTSSVSGSMIVAPYCEAFTYLTSDDSELTYTTLIATSDDTVVKADINNMTTYDYEEGDTEGSAIIALAVSEAVDDDNTTELIVLGSPYMLSDYATQLTTNNETFFSDLVSSIVDEVEVSTVVVAAKDVSVSTITITAKYVVLYGTLITAILPIGGILYGIILWIKRRKQ